MEKTFEKVAKELQLDAIDEALQSGNFQSLANQLTSIITEITVGLNLFDKHKQSYETIGEIRRELRKDSIDLRNLGLKGYYFIEKYKAFVAKKEFTYTLGAQKGNKSETIERVTNISLQEMMLFIGNIQKTRSSDGANAILSGSVSSKKLIEFDFHSNLTDDQVILYQKMYKEGTQKGLKKGIIYEAFEHALADNATSRTRSFAKYFSDASGNIPFYKFVGDVKGVQVKFGGFTLAHISTILTVLQYIQIILVLVNNNRKSLAEKLINVVFKQKTSANTTAKKLSLFIEKNIKGDLKKQLLNLPGVKVTIT